MSPVEAILAFTLAAGILTVTPGLDTALVLRTAAVEGRWTALRAGLGVTAGLLAWGMVAALGLGAVFAASQTAYTVLRWVGGAYLIWLGLRLIVTTPVPPEDAPAKTRAGTERGTGTAGSWLVRGFLSNLLNPKIGVFYITFLPHFIPADAPVVAFSLLLAVLHVLETLLWFAALILATDRLGRWLRRPAVARALDRLTGGVLIAFGLRLALEDRG